MNPKIVKLKINDRIVYGVKIDDVVWAQFWKFERPFEDVWLVKYVKGDEWELEEYKTYKDAKRRAIEVAMERSK